ncbi:uncharacterized protein FA14DRAFT_160916 [Meira miltonrushii]|uniref:HMG box domain-containing protein n=1 Tax=Meira miltonrushii TaxID=1280837 RepID=A0A316VFA3_9BASI|nr:uncharacterized protein FA14DRAFT_160916 [Meira miltonrushii]PWN35994.1 hypothetical protein FA14DRAFT_160916 [Meira miltonrushii]
MVNPLLLRSVTRSLGNLTVASARSYTTSSSRTILSRSTTSVQHFSQSRRSFIADASNQTSTDPEPKKKATTTKAKSTTTKTKTKKEKKPAVKKPKKVKKTPVKKLKAWEKIGPDGKLVPLPSASKPKRLSAFILFVSKRLPELRSDPSLSTTGKDGEQKFEAAKAMKRIAEEYRAFTEEQKAEINEQTAAEGERYQRDLERWRNALTPEDIKRENAYISSQRKKGKSGVPARLRDPTKPKAPKTPFFQFFSDFRSKSSDLVNLSVPEAAKRAGAAWKNLTTEEKEPYYKIHAEEREKYSATLKEWESKTGSD